MNIKKRQKLRRITIGKWVNITPYSKKSITKGCEVMINGAFFRVVQTRFSAVKLIPID